MSMQDYMWRAETAEKREHLRQQWEEAVEHGTIHCECGQIRDLTMAYRCLYCGAWLCFRCAEIHFGQTVQEWIEAKRVELHKSLEGQSEEEQIKRRIQGRAKRRVCFEFQKSDQERPSTERHMPAAEYLEVPVIRAGKPETLLIPKL